MSETAALPIGAEVSDERSKTARVYHITKLLGRGGFGITYLAEATFYDNNIPQTGTYTIKEFCLSDVCVRAADGRLSVAASGEDDFEGARKDFQHEAERLQGLRHRGIVPVNEVFPANGTVYYVMQFLGDTSLSKYVEEQGGRLSEDNACTIIDKIGQALDYLHRQRITHLDVKPQNVMMVKTPRGGLQPVLIDFGLATHYKANGTSTSRHGATGVSDGYSPLEQYAGIEKFSPEADVYALGATLLFMLTGKKPEKAANMNVTVLKNAVSGLNLSNATTKALMGAMQKLAENRTQSIPQFFHLLKDNDWNTHASDADDKTKMHRNRKDGLQLNPKYLLVALAILLIAGGGAWWALRDQTSPGTPAWQTEPAAQVPSVVEEQTATDANTVSTSTSSSDAVVEPSTNNSSPSTGGSTQTTNSGATTLPATQAQPTISNGTKNLGYATYRGQLKNGKPDGRGTLTFSQERRMGSYQIEAGDKIQGEFTDGQLEYGTWYKSDGTSEYIIVGGI